MQGLAGTAENFGTFVIIFVLWNVLLIICYFAIVHNTGVAAKEAKAHTRLLKLILEKIPSQQPVTAVIEPAPPAIPDPEATTVITTFIEPPPKLPKYGQ